MQSENTGKGAREIIAQSLEIAWDRALKQVPSLALLAADGGKMREALLRSLQEGFAAGITDPTELADHALRTSPSHLLRMA